MSGQEWTFCDNTATPPSSLNSRSYMPNCHQNVFLMTCQMTAQVDPLGFCWNSWDPLPSPVTGFVVQSWESPLPRCPCVKRACGQASAPRQMQVWWGLCLLDVMWERVPVEGTRERKWNRRVTESQLTCSRRSGHGSRGSRDGFPHPHRGDRPGLHAPRGKDCVLFLSQLVSSVQGIQLELSKYISLVLDPRKNFSCKVWLQIY